MMMTLLNQKHKKAYEIIDDLKHPQEYENGAITTPDELDEKEMNDPRAQALFERSRPNSLSIFIISPDD